MVTYAYATREDENVTLTVHLSLFDVEMEDRTVSLDAEAVSLLVSELDAAFDSMRVAEVQLFAKNTGSSGWDEEYENEDDEFSEFGFNLSVLPEVTVNRAIVEDIEFALRGAANS